MSGYVSLIQEDTKIITSLYICDGEKVIENQMYFAELVDGQTIFKPLLAAVHKYNEFADILRKSCGCSILQYKELDIPTKKIKTRMLFYKSKH